MQKKRAEVASVELAGMVRHSPRNVDPADDADAVLDHHFTGLSEFAVSAALGSQINYHGARRHARHHFAGDQHGRLLAGNHGSGDHDITFRYHASEKFPLAAVKVFSLRAGISAGILRIRCFDRKLDESRAQAMDLLFGSWPHVVCRRNSSEPARGGDALKSRNSRADYENSSWGNRAGRSRQHAKDSGKTVGGDQHRFVAAYGAHRGK